MANKLIQNLNELTAINGNDEFVVNDISDSGEAKKIKRDNILKSLAAPSGDLDAATKKYVDDELVAARHVFNVKDYGAVGNGSTEDHVAIQAAMDAVSAAGGGELIFPVGTYIIGASLNMVSNIVFRGIGTKGDRGSGAVGGASVTLKAKTNLNAPLINMPNKVGVAYRDIKFDGNKANQSQGNYLVVGDNYTISGDGAGVYFFRCAFVNSKYVQAVRFTGTASTLLVDIIFRECTWYGCEKGAYIAANAVWSVFDRCYAYDNAHYEGYGVFGFFNANCLIVNSDFEGNTGTLIKISGGAQVANTFCIANNDFEAAGAYILVEVDGVNTKFLCNNNTMNTNGGSGIQLTNCVEFNVQNNCILGSTNNGYGVRVTGTCSRFNITGNLITGDFWNGISLDTGTMDYYIVANNNTTDGVVDAIGGAHKVVANNL